MSVLRRRAKPKSILLTSIGKHTKKSFYANIDLLVVELMPLVKHEAAYRSLSEDSVSNIRGFELWECLDTGSTPLMQHNFRGVIYEKKLMEHISPYIRSCGCDWPTIVFESGLSELLDRLRTDAEWW